MFKRIRHAIRVVRKGANPSMPVVGTKLKEVREVVKSAKGDKNAKCAE